MKCSVFSIRDVKTGFLTPTVEVNASVAVRNFEHAVLRNEDSLFFSHPDDYSLFCLGDFDTDTGAILPSSPPVEVISASAIINAAISRRTEGGVSRG